MTLGRSDERLLSRARSNFADSLFFMWRIVARAGRNSRLSGSDPPSFMWVKPVLDCQKRKGCAEFGTQALDLCSTTPP